jgi:hypothetical protein
VDQQRERLRDLSVRVVRLHKALLDRERRIHEDRRGPIPPAELFRLVLHDEEFAWLRSLSALIARVDEMVDGDSPISREDETAVFGEAYRLVKSGGSGDFSDKYRDALQASPDVVIAHAEVSRVLRAPASP